MPGKHGGGLVARLLRRLRVTMISMYCVELTDWCLTDRLVSSCGSAHAHSQAVLNAAARLLFRLRRYDHVTDALAILHWLRLPERVNFKQAPMAYRVLNGMAPSYLNLLVPVSNLPGRRRLRSSFTQQLIVPPYRLSTVGRRSFSVAASTFWNTLPNDIQSTPSLSSFRRQLKTFLFHQSFPHIIL